MEPYETIVPLYTDDQTQETQTDDIPSSEEDNMYSPADGMAEHEETPPDPSPDPSGGEITEKELTDRLDALIDILTPEESGDSQDGGADSSASDPESEDISSAVYDEYTTELLESINSALTQIKADSGSYQEQLVAYQEETLAEYRHMSETFGLGITVLLAVGFFTALSSGCRFADTFFNRMRG